MVALASPNTGDSWGLVWGRQAWLCPSPCRDPDLPGGGGAGSSEQGRVSSSGLSAPLQVEARAPPSAAGCPGHREGPSSLSLFLMPRKFNNQIRWEMAMGMRYALLSQGPSPNPFLVPRSCTQGPLSARHRSAGLRIRRAGFESCVCDSAW